MQQAYTIYATIVLCGISLCAESNLEPQPSVVRLMGHTSEPISVAFSPDGCTLVSAALDATIRLWDISTGRERKVLKLGDKKTASTVLFMPGGGRLVGNIDGESVIIWDLPGLEERISIDIRYRGATNASCFALCPDGKEFCSNGANNTIVIRSVESGKVTWAGKGSGVFGVAEFSPDGKYLVTANERLVIDVWDLEKGYLARSIRAGLVNALAISADSKLVAAANNDKKLLVWDLVSGDSQFSLGQLSRPTSVAFSPNGKLIAVGAEGVVVLVDIATRKEIRKLRLEDDGHVWAVRFSPDGAKVAAACSDFCIRLWNVSREDEGVGSRKPRGPAD